jgi:hypothetical protein
MINQLPSSMPGLEEPAVKPLALPDEVLVKIASYLPWSTLLNSFVFVSDKAFNIVRSLEYFDDPAPADGYSTHVDLSNFAKSAADVDAVCDAVRGSCVRLWALRSSDGPIRAGLLDYGDFILRPLTVESWPLLTHLYIADDVPGFAGMDLAKIFKPTNLPSLKKLRVVPKNALVLSWYTVLLLLV